MPTPRKPIQLRINEGDARRRGKHVLQAKLAAEPRAQVGLPPAPKHLPPRARDVYETWRAELRLMQLDHCPDAIALEGAAMAYCRAVEAELIVEREGAIVDDAVFYQGKCLHGVTRVRKHPAVKIAAANWLLMKMFVVQFGLTPLSRTRLTIECRQDADDDLNELLTGPRLTATERGRLKVNE
jgi:P27 family predicted phage terminase small subunit